MAASSYPTPPRTFIDGLRYCRNPFLVLHHFRHVPQRARFIADLTGASEAAVNEVVAEVDSDEEFQADILGSRQNFLKAAPRGTDFMYLWPSWGSQFFPFVIHYAMVRLLKPHVVMETGGTPGSSSAFMLRAMQRNNAGTLVTLDLPSLGMMKDIKTETEKVWYSNMPKDLPPGWIVPPSLKERHRQVLGDARETMPVALEQFPQLDIFIHDSDHAYDHMLWEYRQAWPHIKPGGILYSDDILLHPVLQDFAREVGLPTIFYDNFGAIKKPA